MQMQLCMKVPRVRFERRFRVRVIVVCQIVQLCHFSSIAPCQIVQSCNTRLTAPGRIFQKCHTRVFNSTIPALVATARYSVDYFCRWGYMSSVPPQLCCAKWSDSILGCSKLWWETIIFEYKNWAGMGELLFPVGIALSSMRFPRKSVCGWMLLSRNGGPIINHAGRLKCPRVRCFQI